MSDLITDEVFNDGQANIAASNMNGIIGRARVQPDVIANKVVSSTMNVADQFLVLKTDNTLARAQFQTLVNSVSSTLPVADTTKNGMLRQLSGNTTDFVDGTNNCQPVSNILPAGMVMSYAGPNIPAGWLKCDGSSQLRTTYPNLFSAIGATYGSVDGTHFTLPNCTSRVVAYYGPPGTVGGATQVALAVGHLPAHSHPITDVVHSHSASESSHTHAYNTLTGAGSNLQSGSGWAFGGATTAGGAGTITVNASGTGLSTTQATGSGVAFSILPPYINMYYIIKT